MVFDLGFISQEYTIDVSQPVPSSQPDTQDICIPAKTADRPSPCTRGTKSGKPTKLSDEQYLGPT